MVFMGTPEFAAKSLGALAEVYSVRLCITQPDRPRGRGKKSQPSPVKETALALGIPVRAPERIREDKDLLEELRQIAPDFIVVVAYGQILPPEILHLPSGGCINLHASLLPAWRGASPIRQAILAGDTLTGNTTMLMDEGLDTGDMLLKEEVTITSDMTYGELHDLLMEQGTDLLIRTIDGLAEGHITPVRQPKAGASYVRKFSKGDACIDFSRPTQEILRLIRGMNPAPLAFCLAQGEPVKILQAQARPWQGTEEPGTILEQEKDGILVKTGDGALALLKLQLPGKRPVSAKDFLNGNRFETDQFNKE